MEIRAAVWIAEIRKVRLVIVLGLLCLTSAPLGQI